ncbi:hypothetical protein F5148DRAFT_1165690 [Russula earlei]|uniref:Uncharacterized protein n=1 Tax=Russula earlei TaxID=71964 RepID=A0ACC0ULN9_9AGAM|nr:hypothetical protein F5148DRAFT_1165690 [Russula earlei]
MSDLCGNPAAEAGEALIPRKRKFDRSKICVKCKTNPGNLVIRHSVYCRDCFTSLITAKFRQALEPHINHASTGPRRGALNPSGGLLVAFSGGSGSSVLLDLVHRTYCTNVGSDELKGGREHPRKDRVWKRIHVCYVETSDVFPETSDRTARMREAVARYEGCEFIPLRVQDAFDRSWWERVSGDLSVLPVDLCRGEPVPIDALKAHLRALPTATAVLYTLSTLTRLLLLYTAYSIGASHLVLGTSLTSLSISLISSISQGGGFVVPQAIQEEWIPPFIKRIPGATSWSGEVRLIRPLRDVGMKECTAWVWWHQLWVVGKQRIPISEKTIGKITNDFIIGLERDYLSTVSTVVKTVGKLAPKGKPGLRCVLCELPTQQSAQGWKARTSIHAFEDAASPEDVPTPLLAFLCYPCHTTLTSKSSRSSKSRNLKSSSPTSEPSSTLNLPTWGAARLACGIGDEESTSSSANEIWVTKKLDTDLMKSLVGEFMLDER